MLRKLLWTGLYASLAAAATMAARRAASLGEAPTDGRPGESVVAPSGPQLGPRPRPDARSGPHPLLVIGIALAAGFVLAKAIDWRSRGSSG